MCQGKANVSPMVYWHWNKFANHGEKKFYTPNWGATFKGWILHESCLLMWHLQVKVQGTIKYWKAQRELQKLWEGNTIANTLKTWRNVCEPLTFTRLLEQITHAKNTRWMHLLEDGMGSWWRMKI
jgi:hypothetical protein